MMDGCVWVIEVKNRNGAWVPIEALLTRRRARFQVRVERDVEFKKAQFRVRKYVPEVKWGR